MYPAKSNGFLKMEEFGCTCLTRTLSPCTCKHSQFLFIFCISLLKMGICTGEKVCPKFHMGKVLLEKIQPLQSCTAPAEICL